MRIAIIENSDNVLKFMAEKVSQYNWDIDYFSGSTDFGLIDLKDYDVIVADTELPTINGRELIKTVSTKTTSQLFLMSSDNFLKEDAHNSRIKGLIDKNDMNNLINQLKYVEVKIRINKLIESESDKFSDMFPSNGYKYEIKDGIMILEIYEYLSSLSKNKITSILNKTKINKTVIKMVPPNKVVTSMYLGLLIYFYKFNLDKNGRVAVWNSEHNEMLKKAMEDCKLTRLCPVYDTLEEAIKFVKT